MGSVTMSPLLARGPTLLLLILVAATTTGKEGCPEAKKCDITQCSLPVCFCSGNETTLEGDHNMTDKPQIVYLTFDDALSKTASDQFYEKLFGTSATSFPFSNPNGCAIRATHFVTHSYTDYSLVNKYWHMGHEIASHSITHRNNLTYWAGCRKRSGRRKLWDRERSRRSFPPLIRVKLKVCVLPSFREVETISSLCWRIITSSTTVPGPPGSLDTRTLCWDCILIHWTLRPFRTVKSSPVQSVLILDCGCNL